MILTDKQILKEIKITPKPKPEQIQPASIDLRLGNEFYLPISHGQDWALDIKHEEPKYQQIKANAICLAPNDFILATTTEKIEVPSNLIGRVEGRSSIGRLGVTIHVTAGFIDPGFKGQITLEIKNLNKHNIILYENMRICQIVFERLDDVPSKIYGECGNKYQNQEGVVGSLIYFDDDTNEYGGAG